MIGRAPVPKNPMQRALRAPWIWVFVSFISVLFAPLPDVQTLATAVQFLRETGASQQDGIAVVGNSVVFHISRCDHDFRSVPEFMSAQLHEPVWNLAFAGQSFGHSIGFAGHALLSPKVKGVVFFLSVFAAKTRFMSDLQTVEFFRLYAGPLRAASVADRLRAWPLFQAIFPAVALPFTYRGRHYPDYAGIAVNYFEPEAMIATCPERLGRDLNFIEAYYWNAYASADIDPANLQDFVALSRRAAARGKWFRVVFLPVDLGDVRTLNPGLEAAIKGRLAGISAKIRAAGICLTDLTQTLPPRAFAERWSASGHLVDTARRTLAETVVRQNACDRRSP